MSREQSLPWVHRPLRLPSRRAGLRLLKFLGLVLLLVVVVVGAIEGWRQWTFMQARAERNEALDRINAHFAEVDDFGPWFDSRVRGSHGGAAVAKAAQDFEHTRQWVYASNIPWHDAAHAVKSKRHARQLDNGDLPGSEVPPDSDVWNQYLVITAPHARAVEGLLNFDHLHATPSFYEPDRDAIIEDFRGLELLRLPYDRAAVLLYIGKRDEAVREALVAHRIANRLMQPQCSSHAVKAETIAGCSHNLLVAILLTGRLTEDELAAFQAENAPVADFFHEVLRGELAQIASRHRSDTYNYVYKSCVTYEGWFGWVTDRRFSVGETYKRYFTEAEAVYHGEAAYLDAHLAQLKLLDAGEQPGQDPLWEPTVHRRLEFAAMNMERERSRALLEIRRREAQGEAWSDIPGRLSAYPSLTITVSGDVIQVGYDHANEATKALKISSAPGTYVPAPPVELRPLR